MSSVLLHEFLSKLCISSEKAACIARHIRFMHHDFNTMIEAKKLDENHQHLNADYKTLADVIIQEVIKRDLCHSYPILSDHIYGEEDGSLKLGSNDEKTQIDVSGTQADILALLKKLFNNESSESIEELAKIISPSFSVTLTEQCLQTIENIPKNRLINLSNIGIWIDPVDGTQQYINGTDGIIDQATGIIQDGLPTALVLIGCFDRENGNAVIGVVNRAFNEKTDPFQWKGLIYWGVTLENTKLNNLDNVYQRNENGNQKVFLYGTVNKNLFKNGFNGWNKLEVSACGNKLLSVALKQANIYVLTKEAAFNWDLCAVHAIAESMNGQILDLHQVADYYRKHQTITGVNLSQFKILYNDIKPDKSQTQTFACKPFIVYHNEQDLRSFLDLLIVNNILT